MNGMKYPTVPSLHVLPATWFLAATYSMFLHEFSTSMQFVFGCMTRSVLAAVLFLVIQAHCIVMLHFCPRSSRNLKATAMVQVIQQLGLMNGSEKLDDRHVSMGILKRTL